MAIGVVARVLGYRQSPHRYYPSHCVGSGVLGVGLQGAWMGGLDVRALAMPPSRGRRGLWSSWASA
jgi:hypothetical protein